MERKKVDTSISSVGCSRNGQPLDADWRLYRATRPTISASSLEALAGPKIYAYGAENCMHKIMIGVLCCGLAPWSDCWALNRSTRESHLNPDK